MKSTINLSWELARHCWYVPSCKVFCNPTDLYWLGVKKFSLPSIFISVYHSPFFPAVSAVKDSATTSIENLGTGPRRGSGPDSLTRLSEYCLHTSSILTNFI